MARTFLDQELEITQISFSPPPTAEPQATLSGLRFQLSCVDYGT